MTSESVEPARTGNGELPFDNALCASHSAGERTSENASSTSASCACLSEPMVIEELEMEEAAETPGKPAKVTWWTNRERKQKPEGEPGVIIAARPRPLRPIGTPFAPSLTAEILSTTARVANVVPPVVTTADAAQSADSAVQSTAGAFSFAELLDVLLAPADEEYSLQEATRRPTVSPSRTPSPSESPTTSVAPAATPTTSTDAGSLDAQMETLLDAALDVQAAHQQRIIRKLPRRALGRSATLEDPLAAERGEDSDSAVLKA